MPSMRLAAAALVAPLNKLRSGRSGCSWDDASAAVSQRRPQRPQCSRACERHIRKSQWLVANGRDWKVGGDETSELRLQKWLERELGFEALGRRRLSHPDVTLDLDLFSKTFPPSTLDNKKNSAVNTSFTYL